MAGHLRVFQHDVVIGSPPDVEDGLCERMLVARSAAVKLDLENG
jgi:hypothetical protein